MTFDGLDSIYKKIRAWDCEDINVLIAYFEIAREEVYCEENGFELQQYAEQKWDETGDQLPIAEEYEERVMKIASRYPVWTCDKKGFCLVGESADTVEHIDTIEEWFCQ